MYYGLSPDVYLAEVDGDIVLLDARANAYFCLPRVHTRGVKAALLGNHRFRPSADLLDELEAAGLFGLIDTPADAPPVESRARRDLFRLPGARARLTPWRAWLLVRAAVCTRLRLCLFRPRRWLAVVARRNAHGREDDGECLLALARLARDIQPFAPAMSSCLPSSLFLLDLLQRHGLRARWVFGVRTYPFEAHCWVEHDDIVLNDSLEHVRWFTPIVAV